MKAIIIRTVPNTAKIQIPYSITVNTKSFSCLIFQSQRQPYTLIRQSLM